jgi:TP901-1 family phage major tail protein
MAAQRGKDMLLKLRDDAGNFISVAGLRSRRLVFDTETVDITHAESAGRWRELLAGAGVKRASLSGSGVFKDDASDALVRQTFFDGVILAPLKGHSKSAASPTAPSTKAKSPLKPHWKARAR